MTDDEMFKSVSVVSLRSKSWPVASHLAPASPPWSLWPAWILGPLCQVAQPAAVQFPPEGPHYITASGSLPRKPCCSGSANSVISKHLLNCVDALNVQENFEPTSISSPFLLNTRQFLHYFKIFCRTLCSLCCWSLIVVLVI